MYQLYSYKCNKRRQAVKEKRLPLIESHLRQETINWSHDRLVEELAKSREAARYFAEENCKLLKLLKDYDHIHKRLKYQTLQEVLGKVGDVMGKRKSRKYEDMLNGWSRFFDEINKDNQDETAENQ